MKRLITAGMLGILAVGSLPGAVRAQQGQGAQNVALVYKLFLDKQIAIRDVGAAASRDGVLGDLLSDGQGIQTGPNTRAAIRFTDDGSILRMNPQTEMQITAEGSQASMQKTLHIDAGELWAKITKHDQATYRIETPTAVAAVKGTEFYVRVDPNDGSTTIITTEGVLDFFNDVGTVEVPAGATAQIGAAAGAAPSVADTEPGEVESFGEINSDVQKTEGDLVEITIPFIDANGNQKVMIIRLPREQAQQYLPPDQQ
jgi:type II secretory pathway pseudopilin PulG